MTKRSAWLKLTLIVALTWTTAGVQGQTGTKNGEWRTYGGDLASTRYAPLDQINATNFGKLQVAWRFKTDVFGIRPDFNLQTTPLMINGVLYATVGARRDAVAIDGATGELLWMYRIDEGKRGAAAPRLLSGRGVAYWTDGRGDERIYMVTIGYHSWRSMEDRVGPVRGFGQNGVIDLKQNTTRCSIRLPGEIGLNTGPIVAKDIVIVGAAHRAGGAPRSRTNAKGYIRGFDVRTGKRLWIFHTIPQPGEYGNETWEKDSWSYSGNTGMWGPFSVDEELETVYLPIELSTGDYFGGHVLATTCSPSRSWLSTFGPGSASGTSSSCITGFGIMTFRVRPSLPTSRSTASASKPSRSRASRDFFTCSIASPGSRSGRSSRSQSRKALFRANGIRRRNRSRPNLRRSSFRAFRRRI